MKRGRIYRDEVRRISGSGRDTVRGTDRGKGRDIGSGSSRDSGKKRGRGSGRRGTG